MYEWKVQASPSRGACKCKRELGHDHFMCVRITNGRTVLTDDRVDWRSATAEARTGLAICLFGFLTSSSTTRLYRGRVPRLTSDNFRCFHTRDRAGIMTSVSAGHIMLTPSKGRAATAVIEPWTSSAGIARSTDWATALPAKETPASR